MIASGVPLAVGAFIVRATMESQAAVSNSLLLSMCQ